MRSIWVFLELLAEYRSLSCRSLRPRFGRFKARMLPNPDENTDLFLSEQNYRAVRQVVRHVSDTASAERGG
jgi:hypothetical protein